MKFQSQDWGRRQYLKSVDWYFPPRIDSKNPFSNDPLRRLEGSPQKRKTNNTKIIWGIIAGCNLKVARFSGSHNFPEN